MNTKNGNPVGKLWEHYGNSRTCFQALCLVPALLYCLCLRSSGSSLKVRLEGIRFHAICPMFMLDLCRSMGRRECVLGLGQAELQ